MTDLVPADPRALESLLAFWAEAGVDACLADAPTDKLAPPPSRVAPVKAVPAPAVAPERQALSAHLEAAVAEARALAAGARDLATLEAVAAAWSGAGLRPPSARTAFLARGVTPARVLVVGGSPGADEEADGAAFSGPAGRLLDRMLSAAGLTDTALCVHLTPWRTPGDRAPTVEEAAAARPFLDRAIELSGAERLLLLGDAPAALLLGRPEGAFRLRGRRVDDVSQGGLPPAFVTFNPAFLLKQSRLKAQAWSDLLTLAREVAPVRNDP